MNNMKQLMHKETKLTQKEIEELEELEIVISDNSKKANQESDKDEKWHEAKENMSEIVKDEYYSIGRSQTKQDKDITR